MIGLEHPSFPRTESRSRRAVAEHGLLIAIAPRPAVAEGLAWPSWLTPTPSGWKKRLTVVQHDTRSL